ncbi:hypothetical protein [Paenibacillus sp. FSL H8-0034]|uniref:hypothetical protein n=1 Tax=Paenibacillus sp. FSL H8-0034 TaxID=2954671 RepID=UPI0030F6956A
MNRSNKIERLLWSIAFPGFGQMLNKKYVKGFTLIVLEFVINSNAHLNQIIILSFNGEIKNSIESTDYHWLMFYPCVYMFGMWDAYKDSGETADYAYLPYVSGAFLGTVGLMYSAHLTIFGILLGPVWMPMLFAFLGIGIGIALFKILYQKKP